MTASLALLCGCDNGESGLEPNVRPFSFAPLVPADALSLLEVDAIVQSAAESVGAPNISIVVVDRVGNILRVWNRNPASTLADYDNRIAASVARTAAYLSHSQAPLTSRTVQFISTFHFPSTFAAGFSAQTEPLALAPLRDTLGVTNTSQGPLWQIDATNRGIAHGPFDPGRELPALANPDGSVPSPGFTALPGGIPLYKRAFASTNDPAGFDVGRRLVGAIGVWISDQPQGQGTPDPEAAELAALQGSRTVRTTSDAPVPPETYEFGPVPPEGAVYLVGILLPFSADAADANAAFDRYGPGIYDAGLNVDAGSSGAVDPFAFLSSPRDSTAPVPAFGGLEAAEIEALIEETAAVALETHAAIRLPALAPTAMVIAVTDAAGEVVGLFRMEDATLFSVDIAITKGRNTFYFSSPDSLDASGPRAGLHPLDGIVPPGTAITCRTLGFLTQPFYPPGIAGTPSGPLFDLALENRKQARFDEMGFAPVGANQSGLILFPGSAPLYKNGQLVGAIGVSGDGVEQDDFVTLNGIRRAEQRLGGVEFEPPAAIRADNFSFGGVTLPYMKFPQHPGG
ncbi:MAG: GlcG/HbpS family heme-binding protein [Planctomycetota bacterium]